jgi:hypothetical protein
MSGEETILARRARLSQVPRACEACKVRKIRCDRSQPCGNCRAAGIACQQAYSVQQSDQRPRQDNRISHLEEYVASLEARLAKVEVRLDKQPAGSSTSTPASTNPPTSTHAVSKQDASVSPAISSDTSVYDVAQTPVGNLYEGSSSFISQFQQASEEIKQSAAAKTPEGQQSISESFNQLNSILHDASSKRPPSHVSTRSIPDITPLPASIVLKIIRTIKGKGAPLSYSAITVESDDTYS